MTPEAWQRLVLLRAEKERAWRNVRLFIRCCDYPQKAARLKAWAAKVDDELETLLERCCE